MVKINPIEKMSTCIADSVMRVKGLDDDQYEVMKYGWYILISDMLKLIIIMVMAQFLGVFQYMVCTIFAIGFLRAFAGGIHAGSWLQCMLVTSAVYFGIVYGAIALKDVNFLLFSTIIAPLCIFILYKFSPADHHNKPMGKLQKKRFRIMSFIVFAVLFLASFIVPPVYSYIIIFSVLAECLLILPVSYRIANNGYGDKYFSAENI